ncbi:2,4-dienoyl-CoA reductase-like NADH-dependent reductase (Old Yellow Enzyme family) [Rhodopirellula rubra]|uniref:2,4-dienoyl-CoA reductase-like NADH-dependent reductase (Old Yellow Enzyme family) n=1 Tax=Aporhodopirellula rubra TaxID=980271 RepID=A0A7W5DWD7_9BACT|nr:NADH:flavin oxidoreductase/NADH oxidase [Aporhodopirellula rubra]MBB3205769.1 2,4-dienoyl-CoA reductase-like NADH-dependent reductase (Old Yellow Enzyme family) [Aporhodopirellula rubra]
MSKLFEPLTLKDVTMRNRIAVSPMCQYSSNDGMPNDWHFVHLGSRAVGGAGLVVVEATAVSPDGRISPADSGIYTDDHVEPFARITGFMEQHGAVSGIQLAHAGRKASVHKPWEGDDSISESQGGWETIAPSAIAFGENITKVPRQMSIEDIKRVQSDFVASTKRALAAGFRFLEIHFAHGYLAHEFYSPLSNQREDEYGGCFENRIRFLMETFTAVRNVWPENLPLAARLSVTDWIDGGVTVEESIELVRRLKDAGLDMLDVSHGFVTPGVDAVPWSPGMMLPHAERIGREAEIATTTSWLITEPEQAEEAVSSGQVDMVMLARELLRDPYWPYHAAKALRDDVAKDILPVQYARAVQ